MPTVLRADPYRGYVFSHELDEPPHVYVDRDAQAANQSAKLWLAPVALARNLGFGPRELLRIERLIEAHEATLLEAWYEHFGS